MKKFWPVWIIGFLMIGFLWVAGTVALAQDQCEVVGATYTVTVDGTEWTLTDFVETGPHFSPAPQCVGTVNFVSPYGEHTCNWCVCNNNLNIAGLPAVLTSNGLKIYGVPTGLHTLRIGDVVYMTEQEVPLLLFK